MSGGGNAGGAGISLRDVTVSYGRHPAVHHVSGEFAPGSLTAIVGPNGAGKTTLLRAIAGVAGGGCRVEGGIDRSGLAATRLGYLPQAASLDRGFPISCLDLVATGLWPTHGAFAAVTEADRARALLALETVGLSGFAGRVIGSLSAGQFQRALFARLLLQDAPVLLLDEPFTALDARTTADLLALLARWHGERRTVIAVLHDMELVQEHFPRTLLIARDPIAWGPTEEVLSAANRLRARRLAEAWEERAEVCRAA
jgi:zinc/manganese transport system ATP-binding protein